MQQQSFLWEDLRRYCRREKATGINLPLLQQNGAAFFSIDAAYWHPYNQITGIYVALLPLCRNVFRAYALCRLGIRF